MSEQKDLLAPPRWRCRYCSRYFWGEHHTVCLCCGRSNGWKSAIKRGIIWEGRPQMGDWPSHRDLHPWEPGPEQMRQSVRVYRCHRLIVGVGMCTWQHAQFGEEPNERCNVHPEDSPKFVGWIDRKWWEARFNPADVTEEIHRANEMRAKAKAAMTKGASSASSEQLPTAITHAELWAAFHKLWTRDASSSVNRLPVNLTTGNGYNKQDWLALERLIEAAIRGPQ